MIKQVRPGFKSRFYPRRNLSRIEILCIDLAREKSHAQRNCSSGDDDNTGITPISYMFRPLSRHDDFPVLCGGPPVAQYCKITVWVGETIQSYSEKNSFYWQCRSKGWIGDTQGATAVRGYLWAVRWGKLWNMQNFWVVSVEKSTYIIFVRLFD